MNYLTSTNPSQNYKILGKVKISSEKEIRNKVKEANDAKLYWKEIGLESRIEILKKLFSNIELKKEKIVNLITQEIGKPINESYSEFESCQKHCSWIVDNAKTILANETTFEDKNFKHQIVYEPIGTVATILPWNLPLTLFSWSVFYNLAVGNTIILKHSEECPLTAKLLGEIVEKSDLPKGVFSQIFGDGTIGQKLIEQDIDMIWFTGSTKVGKELYTKAGKKFIKAVMELGGSNPCVVFDDVDIDQFIPKIFAKRFKNNGQTCDALKRLIVHENIYQETVEKLGNFLKTKTVGNPMNNPDFGSLVNKKQMGLAQSQVDDALKKGAKIFTKLDIPKNSKGAFFPPMIITGITEKMRIWSEEVFAPILSIISFKTEEEAVKLANNSNYGLGSIVFTKDIKRANRIAQKLETGTVEINNANHWLPCNPFGGYKNSGIGREHGKAGLLELCQIKLISTEK